MDISGFAFTVVVKGTVLRLAVDTDFRTAAAGGVGHRALTALLEALAARFHGAFGSASAFAEEHRMEIQKCVDDGAKEMPKRGESRRMRQVHAPAAPAAPAAEREETYDTL